MIKQHILRESFQEISHDTKFIRLATVTTFIHSVIFLLYLTYVVANVFSQHGENQVVTFLLETLGIAGGVNITLIILVGALLLIGYAVLPPIGEGAMIFYLNNPKKQGTLSLGKGMSRFLQMFEFDAAISFVTIPVLLIAISRFYVMGIIDSFLVITTLIIWFIIICFAAFLLPYTKYFIVLEGKKFFEAMKYSMTMSIEHFALTFRFIIVDALLHVRFIINIIIVFGIPLGLMYVANWLGIAENGILRTVFIIIVIVLFLLTAYINGIIEAFFTTYRYKLYKHILVEESDTQAAIDKADLTTDLATPENPEAAPGPQQVIINQYVMGPQGTPGQPQPPQYPNQQYVVPDHEYTVPQTPTGTPQPLPTQPQGVPPQPIPSQQPVQPIGTHQIPSPDGGHYVYVPPKPPVQQTPVAPVHPTPQPEQTPPVPQAPEISEDQETTPLPKREEREEKE